MAPISPDVLGRGFTNCCSSDEVDGRDDEEKRMLAVNMKV
jgi:hypothetical protein